MLRTHGYDVVYSALLRFRGGAHGTLMVGWSLPAATPGYGSTGVTVVGEGGVLRVDQGAVGIVKIRESGAADVDVSYAPEVHGRIQGTLALEVDHFVSCTAGLVEPLCTAHDGSEAVRAGLAMEDSAAIGEPVRL